MTCKIKKQIKLIVSAGRIIQPWNTKNIFTETCKAWTWQRVRRFLLSLWFTNMNLVCGPRKRRCFLLPVGTPYGLWSTHIFFALILVREKWLKHFFIIIFFFITKALLLFLIYFSRRFFTRKWNKHPIDNKWNNPHRSNLQNCNLLIRRWHIAPTLKPLGFYFSFLFFLLPFFDGSTFPFLLAQSNQRALCFLTEM